MFTATFALSSLSTPAFLDRIFLTGTYKGLHYNGLRWVRSLPRIAQIQPYWLLVRRVWLYITRTQYHETSQITIAPASIGLYPITHWPYIILPLCLSIPLPQFRRARPP